MDKAQEKIAGIIDCNVNGYRPLASGEGIAEVILKTLEQLGYRKLSEGEPPLLSDEEIRNLCYVHYKEKWQSEEEARYISEKITFEFSHKVAQAQRDSGIKWIRNETY